MSDSEFSKFLAYDSKKLLVIIYEEHRKKSDILIVDDFNNFAKQMFVDFPGEHYYTNLRKRFKKYFDYDLTKTHPHIYSKGIY